MPASRQQVTGPVRYYHKISHLSTANIGGFLFLIFAYILINDQKRGRLARTWYGEPSRGEDGQHKGKAEDETS